MDDSRMGFGERTSFSDTCTSKPQLERSIQEGTLSSLNTESDLNARAMVPQRNRYIPLSIVCHAPGSHFKLSFVVGTEDSDIGDVKASVGSITGISFTSSVAYYEREILTDIQLISDL